MLHVCKIFYASFKMEASTCQSKKGCAGSLPSAGRGNTPRLSGCHSHPPLYCDKEDVQIPEPRKMWTPLTETSSVCWDWSANLIWPLETRRQLWAALQSSTAQSLPQPPQNLSWNEVNSCKWSVKGGNEDMLSRDCWSEGIGDLTSHNVLCSEAVRIS